MPDTDRVMVTDDAFADLYRSHYAAIWRYVARRLGAADDHAVRDVVAEVFTTAWRRRSVVPPEPRPWLYGVARHVLANERRGNERRQRLAVALTAHHRTSPAADVTGTDRPAVLDALARLSPADQEVLGLAAWEDLGPADIAVVLRCSRSAASMRLHRARVRLREALTALEPPPVPSTVPAVPLRAAPECRP